MALPADFSWKWKRVGCTSPGMGKIVRKLRKMDFNVALEKLSGKGEPEAYSTFGDSIQLLPDSHRGDGAGLHILREGQLIFRNLEVVYPRWGCDRG